MDVYFVDGEFVSEDRATISVKDLSILRGYGVFDFTRTYNGRPFHLEDHVERFFRSARKIGLEPPYDSAEICRIVRATLERNGHHREANVRMVYTGGVSADGLIPGGKGKLIVYVSALQAYPAAWYTDGVKVITVNTMRHVPGAKSTSYLTAILAQLEAREKNAIEAIYVDPQGRMLEGTTVNLFFFKGNRLVTPGESMLKGITREVILDEIAPAHFEVEVRDVHVGEIAAFDEAFITGSNKEIVPVVAIDDQVIGKGTPGANTGRLMKLWRDHTIAYGGR